MIPVNWNLDSVYLRALMETTVSAFDAKIALMGGRKAEGLDMALMSWPIRAYPIKPIHTSHWGTDGGKIRPRRRRFTADDCL